MADDPIRDALRVAGEAARNAFIRPGCCMEGTGCEMPPCHCSQVAAAAAVAAFLDRMIAEERKLCAQFRKAGITGAAMQSASVLLAGAEWRNAVERAARRDA